MGTLTRIAPRQLVAAEVKAGRTYRREDLRGLAHLRDRLGDRFLGTAVVDQPQSIERFL
ncbi:MAG: hypothetical protein ACRDRK_19865 [Pseudonocardia sp.]